MTTAPVMKELNKVQKQPFADVVFKIGVLGNFEKFTGKHQCWNLVIITLHARRPATLLKRGSNLGFFL